jgi:hypothetical protein
MVDHIETYIDGFNEGTARNAVGTLFACALGNRSFFFGSSVSKLLSGESLGDSDVDIVIEECDLDAQQKIADLFVSELQAKFCTFNRHEVSRSKGQCSCADFMDNFVHEKITLSNRHFNADHFSISFDLIFVVNFEEFRAKLHSFDHLLVFISVNDGTLSAPEPVDPNVALEAYKSKIIMSTYYDTHAHDGFKQTRRQFIRLFKYLVNGYEFDGISPSMAKVLFEAYRMMQTRKIRKELNGDYHKLGQILTEVYEKTGYEYKKSPAGDEYMNHISAYDIAFICGCAVVGNDEKMFDDTIAKYGIEAFKYGFEVPCAYWMIMSYMGNYHNEQLWTKVLDLAAEYFEKYQTRETLPYCIAKIAGDKMKDIARNALKYLNIEFYNWLTKRDAQYALESSDIAETLVTSYTALKRGMELGLFTLSQAEHALKKRVKCTSIYQMSQFNADKLRDIVDGTMMVKLNPAPNYYVGTAHVGLTYTDVHRIMETIEKTNPEDRDEFIEWTKSIKYDDDSSLYDVTCDNVVISVVNSWKWDNEDSDISFVHYFLGKHGRSGQIMYLNEYAIKFLITRCRKNKDVTDWILRNTTIKSCFKFDHTTGMVTNMTIESLLKEYNFYLQSVASVHRDNYSITDIIFGDTMSMNDITEIILLKTMVLSAKNHGMELEDVLFMDLPLYKKHKGDIPIPQLNA